MKRSGDQQRVRWRERAGGGVDDVKTDPQRRLPCCELRKSCAPCSVRKCASRGCSKMSVGPRVAIIYVRQKNAITIIKKSFFPVSPLFLFG